MKGCPHCDEFKKMLNENNINFFDRDIETYEDEYRIYVEITENEYVPTLLIIEGDESDNKSFIYCPSKDYNTLEEAITIVESHVRTNQV